MYSWSKIFLYFRSKNFLYFRIKILLYLKSKIFLYFQSTFEISSVSLRFVFYSIEFSLYFFYVVACHFGNFLLYYYIVSLFSTHEFECPFDIFQLLFPPFCVFVYSMLSYVITAIVFLHIVVNTQNF